MVKLRTIYVLSVPTNDVINLITFITGWCNCVCNCVLPFPIGSHHSDMFAIISPQAIVDMAIS